jgi:hypothetical protein
VLVTLAHTSSIAAAGGFWARSLIRKVPAYEGL